MLLSLPIIQKLIRTKNLKPPHSSKGDTKTLLWLDDRLNPMDTRMDWLSFSPVGREVEVIWVKNFHEFQNWICNYGLPKGICFDHDLGKDKPTGYDCAAWLIKYCTEHNKPLPLWSSQCADPAAKAKIKKLLKSYSASTEIPA
ncbi:cyclic-phosphate processing receiver domain-containing protein [Christiangramia fulva]|uniref:cyclic-phosphate processing receiver domain-containing protein n=1 Tax=Christiangramia fulva TaxID=2126553 RepID=UPI00131C2120|nr:cyclic-phosphate processing receiver domain-containing protein [Christiangramia fulva]